jgi:hypothetical protein
MVVLPKYGDDGVLKIRLKNPLFSELDFANRARGYPEPTRRLLSIFLFLQFFDFLLHFDHSFYIVS